MIDKLHKIYVTILTLLTFQIIYADIAPNPIFVNGVIPSDSCKIQMVSETVNAWVYMDSSIVECEFILKNHSSKSNLSVGFPIMSFYHWSPPENWMPEKENFAVWVDGNQINQFDRFIPKYVLEEQDKMEYLDSLFFLYFQRTVDSLKAIYPICSRKDEIKFYQKFDNLFDSLPNEKERIALKRKLDYLVDYQKTPWYLWNMEFDSLETRIVKLRYSIPCGYGYWGRYQYFKYILSTGSGWYKKIEKAEIIVNIMDFKISKVDSINPKTYSLVKDKKLIEWNLKDIEPEITDNIYVEYSFGKKKFKYWYHKKFKFYVIHKWLSPRNWIYQIKDKKRYKQKCKESTQANIAS